MNAKLTGTRGGRWAKPAALVGAGVLAGTVVGLGVTANASTATPTATPSTSATADSSGAGMDDQYAPRPPRGNETPLTGDELTKATAAAKAAVPGATVVRAETDADGGTYEVHMIKADGSHVRVALDTDFKVTDIDSRAPRGPGHRGPKGTPLTGTDLTKATEAAESAVADGTLKFAVKQADGTFTAFLEKADGTHVRVTLDKDFKVTGQQVDDRRGRDGNRGGCDRGRGGPGDLPPMPSSDAPAPGASTGSTGGPLTGATESSSYAA